MGREACTKMDFLIALALLDCTAWTHPISGQTGKPLQIPQHNFSPLGWNQSLLTFSSPSLSKKRCFCSMAWAEENCRGKKKPTTKKQSQVPDNFQSLSSLPPLLTHSHGARSETGTSLAVAVLGWLQHGQGFRVQTQRRWGLPWGGGSEQELGETANAGFV